MNTDPGQLIVKKDKKYILYPDGISKKSNVSVTL